MMSADNLDNIENLVHEQNSSIEEIPNSNPSDPSWPTVDAEEIFGSKNSLNEPLNKFLNKAVKFINENLSEENLNRDMINNIGDVLLNNRNSDSSSTSGNDVNQQSSVELYRGISDSEGNITKY